MLADDLQGDIGALLDDPNYGQTIILRSVTPGSYDQNTQISTQATADYTTRGLLLSYADKYIDGETIRRGDRKCVIKGTIGVTPQAGDVLFVGATSTVPFSVIWPKRVELTDVTIIWVLQIRKGG